MSCFTVILSAGLAAGLLLTVRPAAAQEETSFKLAGTDTYIRHQNSQGVLSKIGFNDNVARKDATFRLQFGLAGKCVSLVRELPGPIPATPELLDRPGEE